MSQTTVYLLYLCYWYLEILHWLLTVLHDQQASLFLYT